LTVHQNLHINLYIYMIVVGTVLKNVNVNHLIVGSC